MTEYADEGGGHIAESRCSMGKVTMEREHAETRIAGSSGCKMIIPVCNASVPGYWEEKVLETSEIFMHVYNAAYGRMPESIYVAGSLIASLERNVPTDRKFRLHIAVIVEENGSGEQKDCMTELPILPDSRHFAEARQCFPDEFLEMFGGPEQRAAKETERIEETGIWKVELR